MLTEQHIPIIKSTIPLLENAGPALTKYFYQRMFLHAPELQNIFNMSNQANGKQQVALFEAIAAYAKNIENVAVLQSAVERIAQKHTSLNIQPEHYQVVGHHLIETLRELTGDAFSIDVEEAWTAAYQFLAQIFIDREAELYQQRAASIGGWRDARAFKVIDKIVESDLVKSFIFSPVDQQGVISFSPGQYLGIEVTPNKGEYKEIRQYSLSAQPNGETYRISVKREATVVPGKVSNYLHDDINIGDEVNLYAPAGDFFFVNRKNPVVLISAGVGITPMQAMLETLAEQNYEQTVHYLHACESSGQHSFAPRTTEIIKKNDWQQHIWYQTKEQEQPHVSQGVMDFNELALPIHKGDFYLCGPTRFMQFAKQQLLALGVTETRIHYEVFGPHQSL
ncbi:NO-inducible flavohemoprotein [Colwellia sp. Bg11-12]|uniref:NO-inducible flavohemoprotein n=1 Tax=Colwellia sp. Bg11-12 TaxID=2759817 RepID=UPI0015F720FE|nr:NO-inducible flavohemoprotein [Colwellia sp. Bg11-12]MBA6262499.1 NO-inducible flavohemoprotein [Colwellia sp. Bg11-12]